MAINQYLMNLLLSMDAYNRGYNAGIELNTNAVGTANIQQTTLDGVLVNFDSVILRDPVSLDRLDDNIGFYALSYDYNGETIISYCAPFLC